MDHLTRIQRAIDFIEENLKEELTTGQIAKVAAFSTWHFQKVFSSMVGYTVKDYVRKRRLTSALNELVSTDHRIIDIALDYQFEAQESFTRAFRAMFGVTPGECRRKGLASVFSLVRPRITIEYLDQLYGGMAMEPKFVTIGEKKVIGLSTHFISILSDAKNNHILLPDLWGRYLKRAGEIKQRKGKFDIGLCEAIPDEFKKNHPDEYFYMACSEVDDFATIPPGMSAKTVPAGRYAVFTHKGKLDRLERTMNYIFGSWLPKSGEELRNAPDLEIYDERFKPHGEGSEVDLYIPVK